MNGEEAKFYDYHGIKAKKFDKVTLKKDQYLIIGDNFKESYDGRYFGPDQQETDSGDRSMRKGYVRARKIERNLPRKVEFQGTGKNCPITKNEKEIYM